MSDRGISLADDLTIPVESVTQTFAVLGKRGSGKTHTASVLTEELLGAGSQVVVVDPLDAWWGLRAGADGESEGLPIVVLGGQHGDLPLDATNGTVIADLVVGEGVSVVLSLRHLSKTAQRRFVAEFAERLYHRKGEDRNRSPLHVVIDEADAFVPQRVAGDTARVMGAVDDLVRRGRSSGIGVTLITQRASVIHKDVLTQLEVLIVLRTVSPQDRKAIELWIEAHDPEDRGREVLASLASLPVGTAWVWSPGWLEILRRVRIRTRRTFDSSATPKVGERAVEPRTLAPVDLERIQAMLAETIEQAEANDPRALRREIAQLQKQLVERPAQETEVRVETVYALSPMQQTALTSWCVVVDRAVAQLADGARAFRDILLDADTPATVTDPPATPPPRTVDVDRTAPHRDGGPGGKLRQGARRMLASLVRMNRPLTRQQLATLSGFTVSGGTFGTYLGDLKRGGFVDETDGQISITAAGNRAVGDEVQDIPASTAELVEVWRSRLRSGERKMLDILIDAYPATATRQELGRAAGFEVSGGTFGTYLGVLRRNGLVDVDGPDVRASDTLFLT